MLTLYRYEGTLCTNGVSIQLHKRIVLEETPKGYWNVSEHMIHFSEEAQKRYRRWTSKTAKKRYCYPTKEEAWESFIRRKKMYIYHLEQKLDYTKKVLNVALSNNPVTEDSLYKFVNEPEI